MYCTNFLLHTGKRSEPNCDFTTSSDTGGNILLISCKMATSFILPRASINGSNFSSSITGFIYDKHRIIVRRYTRCMSSEIEWKPSLKRYTKTWTELSESVILAVFWSKTKINKYEKSAMLKNVKTDERKRTHPQPIYIYIYNRLVGRLTPEKKNNSKSFVWFL
jgi:hypothetical protein